MVLLFRTGKFTVIISRASKQGFNLFWSSWWSWSWAYCKHMQKVQAHSGTMCCSGKIWGDAVILILFAKRDQRKLAGWSMNHRTTAHLLTQCAVSKLVNYLNSASLPVNLIPKKKRSSKDSPKHLLFWNYSWIPGHTYYSQKDASTIYLSLV